MPDTERTQTNQTRRVNLPHPAQLETKGNLATNWKRYKRAWDNYEVATGLDKQESKIRAATFMTVIGPNALDIIDGLPFTVTSTHDEREDIDVVLQKMDMFCVGETNEIYERYIFNKRDQESNELIDKYVAALRSLAKTSNYKTLEDDLVRDRIVVGVKDNNTRKLILAEKKLTLSDCIAKCRAQETTAQQVKNMCTQEDVHELRVTSKKKLSASANRGRKSKTHALEEPKEKQKRQKKSSCRYCGQRHPYKKELCPAFGKQCSKCLKMNHFANRGKTKLEKVHECRESDSETDNSEDIFFVESGEAYQEKIFARMMVNGKETRFQLDCGATVNVLP